MKEKIVSIVATILFLPLTLGLNFAEGMMHESGKTIEKSHEMMEDDVMMKKHEEMMKKGSK